MFRGDGAVRFADCIKPGVECEVAVRLAHDLPPGSYTASRSPAAVGEFVAGIEIVENRYDDLKTLGTPTLIADQVYHVAAVIGDQGGVDWRALDIGALRGRILIDGVERDAGVTSRPAGSSVQLSGVAGGFLGRRRVRRVAGRTGASCWAA